MAFTATQIISIELRLNQKPPRRWRDIFAAFDWTAATGLVPSHDPQLVGARIKFPDVETHKVIEAIRAAMELCDRLLAAEDAAQ